MNIARAAVVAAFVIMPNAAFAASAQDLLDGMAKCATIAANGERLACYDALGAQLKAAPPAPDETATAAPPPVAAPLTTPPPATAAPAPPAATADNRPWYSVDRLFGVDPRDQTKPQQFGSENLAPPAPPPGQQPDARNTMPVPIDSISAGVTDYSFNPYGQFVVFLDNGQIWKQIASDSGIAHFAKGERNTVVISRGALGSYNMVINDASSNFKVIRVK